MWVHTPHGMIYIRVGYGGIHKIVSWVPHEIKMTKTTTRGEMQVTHIEPDFDSVYTWQKQVEAGWHS